MRAPRRRKGRSRRTAAMSVIEVSVMAGEILSTLERRGGIIPLEQLTLSRRCSRDLVMLALGWLFKEGFVVIQPAMGDWFITARTRGAMKVLQKNQKVELVNVG